MLNLATLAKCGWKIEQDGVYTTIACPKCNLVYKEKTKDIAGELNVLAATGIPFRDAAGRMESLSRGRTYLHCFSHGQYIGTQYQAPQAILHFIAFVESLEAQGRSNRPELVLEVLRFCGPFLEGFCPAAADILSSIEKAEIPSDEYDIPPRITPSEASRALQKARVALKRVNKSYFRPPGGKMTDIDDALFAIAKVCKKL